MTDDAELLSRYATDRSEAAFAELVRKHVDLVFSAALRQTGGSHHRAQEVTQMVFIDLARKAAALIRHPVLPAWLYRTCHLEAANALRREGRQQKYEQAAGAEASVADADGGKPTWEEVRPVLDDAMNDLNERDREAVVLRFFSNQAFSEIGRQLGLTENAARMRVERALAKLNELLSRRGIKSSSSALAAALAGNAVLAAPTGAAIAATGAALAGAGSAAGAWIAFMTSTKLPITLTAALVLGGAGIGVFQERANRQAAHELADLSHENQAISVLKDQIQRLAASAQQVQALRDDAANLDALQAQVRDAETKAVAQLKEAAVARARKSANDRQAHGLTLNASDPAFDVSQLDKLPSPVNPMPPTYPREMVQAGISGQVTVDMVVGADGSVYNAYAASSTKPEFEAPAVQAVGQWKFNPGQKSGQAVNTHVQIPIVFSLSSSPSGDAWF